jgi:hypothetical protein
VTFPTADVRIEAGPFRLFAICSYLDTPLESGRKGTGDLAAQAHKFTGIGPVNGWDRTRTAEGTHPGSTDQAAFFMVATTIVIAIEILAFRTGGGLHILKVPLFRGTYLF